MGEDGRKPFWTKRPALAILGFLLVVLGSVSAGVSTILELELLFFVVFPFAVLAGIEIVWLAQRRTRR